MIKIAIVGEIGSGKTFISKLFGYPVFNADDEVVEIYKKNRKCFNKLKKKFPKQINSFPIKKKCLIDIILKKKYNIKIINKIVHPMVRLRMNNFLKKNKNKKAVVLDIPLFLENNLNKKKDNIIFVNSKIKDIKKKILKRNMNHKLIETLRTFQLSKEIKKKKSNYIINNNFKINKVKKDVKIIREKILKNERNYT